VTLFDAYLFVFKVFWFCLFIYLKKKLIFFISFLKTRLRELEEELKVEREVRCKVSIEKILYLLFVFLSHITTTNETLQSKAWEKRFIMLRRVYVIM